MTMIRLNGYTDDLTDEELDELAAYYAEHPEEILRQVEEKENTQNSTE